MENLDKEIRSRRLELPRSSDYDPDLDMDFPDDDDVDSLLDEELQRQEDWWFSDETQRLLRQAKAR